MNSERFYILTLIFFLAKRYVLSQEGIPQLSKQNKSFNLYQHASFWLSFLWDATKFLHYLQKTVLFVFLTSAPLLISWSFDNFYSPLPPHHQSVWVRKLATCENRIKRARLIFRSLGGAHLTEDFEPDMFGIPQLETVNCSVKPYVYLPQRQTRRPLQGKQLFCQRSPGDCLGLLHLRVNEITTVF